MVRIQDISIKQKLRAIIMIASAVALLLVSAGFVTYELITRRQILMRDLATLAEVIGNESAAALAYEDEERAQEVLGALRAKPYIVAAALYKDGRLFAQYPADPTAPGFFPKQPGPKGPPRFERGGLVLFHEIRVKGDPTGTIYLKSDLKEFHERFQRYAVIIILFMLASAAVTYVLSSILQRIISRPIFHLAETAKAVSVEKNYSVRATKHGDDELGQLIDGFNEMLGQIQQQDANLQQAHDKLEKANDELEKANDELEKNVQERTVALRAEIAERQRAEIALKEQLTRISLLNQITQVISKRQDLESILRVVLRQLEDHLSLDLGGVALFDAQVETLNLAALRLKNSFLRTKLGLTEGAVLPLADTGLRLCRDGQTVYLSDTVKAPAELAARLAGAGLRSFVAAPLPVENELFGVMLAARLAPDGFSAGEREFLRMLSEHVALAAHQAKLHQDLEGAYHELRHTQQTVMQHERLKALGQMASGIAHDVNNAVSPVVGFAHLMEQGEPGLTANGKRYLKHIMTAGEDIAHIVARLREFYRPRDERESLQKLNLNTVAQQVIGVTRPRWRDIPQSRGITIEMQADLAPDVPELVGIESEVREALTNLVLNAVDALPNGGRIAIRTRVTRGEVLPNAAKLPIHVGLEISDSGIGMDEETRKRCLEPFFSTKGKRGTGLGLAMVYGVMQRHEGTIEIQSELGQGTTFRLIFPVRQEACADLPAGPGGEGIEPLQILCIDDEPLLRDLIKEMLEGDGHTVVVCDGGQSGLDTFRQARERGHPFDLVITDLGMPYLDGRAVAKALKCESPATPILMLTGWGTLLKEEGSTPAQVDGVLSKPPRPRELREMLSRLSPARHGSVPLVSRTG